MRAAIITLLVAALGPATAAAQDAGGGQEREWSVSASVAIYGLPVDAYIEGEYVFARTSEDSFAYHWSEAAIAPVDWLRAGIVTQRTRAYATDRNIQRGPFVNATFEPIDAAVYIFIAERGTPTVVLSLGVDF